MKDMRLRAKNIKDILETNRYVLFRMTDGELIGINCKIVNTNTMKAMLSKSKMNWRTRYIGFKTCSFNEYLNYKGYFIKS